MNVHGDAASDDVDGTRPVAASPRALFLASTPLHTFWFLGLAQGPFADCECVLALIDQRAGDRDLIAEALEEDSQGPITRVLRFPELGSKPAKNPAKMWQMLAPLQVLAKALDPGHIVVGNDRRIEFYAALQACPRAIPAYVDDGLFSYVPMKKPHRGPIGRGWATLAQLRRNQQYGMPVEQPRMVGGSQAVQEAWVMLPDRVHAGLASKKLRPIEASWYARPAVRDLCSRVIQRAGLEPGCFAHAGLLLVLPHDSFLEKHPDIRLRLERLADSYVQRNAGVAYKCHPRSLKLPIELPASGCFEVPRRLPVEILAPLLSDVLVVGAMTTALVSLMRLGRRVEVRSLTPEGELGQPTAAVYRSLHIDTLA